MGSLARSPSLSLPLPLPRSASLCLPLLALAPSPSTSLLTLPSPQVDEFYTYFCTLLESCIRKAQEEIGEEPVGMGLVPAARSNLFDTKPALPPKSPRALSPRRSETSASPLSAGDTGGVGDTDDDQGGADRDCSQLV